MRYLIVFLIGWLMVAPVAAQPATLCWIVAGPHGHHKHYACASGDDITVGGVPGAVSKAWFKAHCTSNDPATRDDQTAATCDAPPVGPTSGEAIAAPPGFWHRVKLGAEYGLAAGLVFALIASGGGGAFQ